MPEYHKLHAKAMECAGPIGLTVSIYHHITNGRKVSERIQRFRRTSHPSTKVKIFNSE